MTPERPRSGIEKASSRHLSDFLMLPVMQNRFFEPSARVSVNQCSCVRSSVPSFGVMKQLSSRLAETRIAVISVRSVVFSGKKKGMSMTMRS